MDGLKLFENPEFGKVRTITEDGKVLFCGSDVAKRLDMPSRRTLLTVIAGVP